MADIARQGDQDVRIVDATTQTSAEVITDGGLKELRVHDKSVADLTDKDRKYLDDEIAFIVVMEYLMSDGQTIYQSFKTPNSAKRIYVRWEHQSDLRTDIQLFESPTNVAYSFSWTPKNRNRDSSATADSLVKAVSSLDTAGTYLAKTSVYKSPLEVKSVEFKLKPNTEYVFAMKSYGASNLTYLKLVWYEK